MHDDRGLLEALLGDGRFLVALTGCALVLSGGFAIFQSVTGSFLPHDVHALGFDAAHLRSLNGRVVNFMFHDRVAFGGTLLAIGLAYWFLAEFPMREGEPWAWWTLLVSGASGFASFLTYLGYGYFDLWHGVATLVLIPVFGAGLWRSRPRVIDWADAWYPGQRGGLGRYGLGFLAAGMGAAGATIMLIGMSNVFVPQDLAYMQVTPEDLGRISPRLVPVIAHDRAGFGGGLFSTGIILGALARHARLTRGLVQLVVLMGAAGFGAALGVHHVIGYTDFMHVLPAYAGLFLFAGTALRLAGEYRALSARSE